MREWENSGLRSQADFLPLGHTWECPIGNQSFSVVWIRVGGREMLSFGWMHRRWHECILTGGKERSCAKTFQCTKAPGYFP